MSIKRSFLESKWYYRIARVIFLWVPSVLVVVGIILVIISNMSGKSPEDIAVVLQSNRFIIGYTLIGLFAYLLILKGIWRGFLYIVFGGVEDDTKPKVIAAVPPIGQVSQPIVAQDGSAAVVNYLKEAERKKSEAVTWILLIIAVIWIAVYYSTSSSSTSGGGSVKTKTSTSTCIPTGCGSNWHCSGSYYSGQVQKSISGCYASNQSSLPSWTGICRKCP